MNKMNKNIMNKMLRPFIVKVSVSGYFPICIIHILSYKPYGSICTRLSDGTILRQRNAIPDDSNISARNSKKVSRLKFNPVILLKCLNNTLFGGYTYIGYTVCGVVY